MCDYNRTDAERDDDREAMTDDHAEALEHCAVCDELACPDANCPIGCYHKHGERVGRDIVHAGGCLELYREGEATMAVLAVAVGR
jgi:hypothetical protein